MDKQQIEIIKKAINDQILKMVSEQKTALIKAGPGKDKSVNEVVDDLHKQISIRLEIISKLDELTL